MSTTSVPAALGSDRPLAGMTYLFASPTYGHTDPHIQKNIRVAIMNVSKNGGEWAGDGSPDRMPYGLARNSVAQIAFEREDVDGVVWVDSDVLLGPRSLTRLLHGARAHNLDFVTGVYHQREPPYLPAIYIRDPGSGKFCNCLDYPPDRIAPVDGCGFGIVYTSRALIQAIAFLPDFDFSHGGWFPDRRDVGGSGEDLSFCIQAKDAGFQLYVDTGVNVGHARNTQFITEADFRAGTQSAPEIPSTMWGVVG